jgi:hypothetical protein
MTDASTSLLDESPLSASWAIEPLTFLSPHFGLYRGSELIATLQMNFWSEGGNFEISGHKFQIRRSSLWRDGFQLLANDGIVYEVKHRFWSRQFDLTGTDPQWVLEPAGWFTYTYCLMADGQSHGVISRNNWWSRKRTAHFDKTVPPPIQLLAIFLVLIVAKRESKSD